MRWPAQQRQKFIAGRLAAQGFINRDHLKKKFGISTVQASVDLRAFMAANPTSITYNSTAKRYERA